MKKLWTILASSLMFASVSFAQDDFDSEYYDQAEEQVAEQPEEQPADQEQASEQAEEPAEQTADAEEAPSAPAPAQYQAQTNVQEPEQANVQNDEYAQEGASRQQSSFGVGVRFAFDYARMYGFKEDLENDSDIDGTPSGFGYEGGLMFRIQMIPNLYFAPEANFAYVSTSHKFREHKRKYNSMDLEIPLLMRGVVADKFYVTGGAQFNFTLSSKVDIEDIENRTLDIVATSPEGFDQATFGFGIVAGAGFNIVQGLFIDLRYYMGITELYPDVITPEDVENLSEAKGNFSQIDMAGARMMKFKIGLSYWFM